MFTSFRFWFQLLFIENETVNSSLALNNTYITSEKCCISMAVNVDYVSVLLKQKKSSFKNGAKTK